MKLIYENLDFLKKISKIRSVKKRNALLAEASTAEILSLLEITINILKFRVKLNSKQRRKLMVYADYLRKLGRKRTEKSVRETLQTGEGAILPALIIPIIAQAVASYLNNRSDGK
jgi:hypothetical protein